MSTLPTREERRAFLEERQAGVRSSDVPRLLGLYGNPLEVYYEKTRPVRVGDDAGGLAMPINLLRGVVREREIVELYVEHRRAQGLGEPEVEEIGVRSKPDPDCPALGTHVDRIVVEPDGRRWPLEAKAPSVHVYRRLAERGFDVSYYVQLQVHIACHESDVGGFAASNLEPHGLPPVVAHLRRRDEDVIRVIRRVADHFWTEHVLPRRPPAVDAYERYLAELPDPEPALEGELVIDPRGRSEDGIDAGLEGAVWDPELVKAMRRLLEARRHKRVAREIEEEARSVVEDALRDHGCETVRVPGLGWAHWREVEAGLGQVDVELLEAAEPVDRDALERLLGQLSGDRIEAVRVAVEAGDLGLDVASFRKRRRAYRRFTPYAEQEEER